MTQAPDYKPILERFDETAWEFPSDFDQEALSHGVTSVQRKLEQRFGRKLKVSGRIEDASFHADIFVRDKPVGPVVRNSTVRFSNFGRLATVTSDDLLVGNELEVICEVLKEYEFTFIPAEALEVDYFGQVKEDGVDSWWRRYFDYI